MFTFISSRLSLEAVQHGSLFTDYLSDTSWKYAKVALVALSIIGAVATFIYVYRRYTAKELEPEESAVPSDISPKSAAEGKVGEKAKGKAAEDPKGKSEKTKEDPKGKEGPKADAASPTKEEVDDEKYAQQLLQEDLDQLEDSKIAKMYNYEYNQDLSDLDKPKPPVPTVPAKTAQTPAPVAKLIALTPTLSMQEAEDFLFARKLQEALDESDTDTDTNPTTPSATTPAPVITPTPAPVALPTLDTKINQQKPVLKTIKLDPPGAFDITSFSNLKRKILTRIPVPVAVPTPAPVAAPTPAPVIVPTAVLMPTPAPVVAVAGTDKILPLLDFILAEEIFAEISKTILDPNVSTMQFLTRMDQKIVSTVKNLLNEIMTEFETRYSISKKHTFLNPVPLYSNDTQLSDHERKYLSLAGMRNLLSATPAFIIDDFRKTQFLAGEHNYTSGGLKKFKSLVGHDIHLDTAIEAKDDAEAIDIAREMIVRFGSLLSKARPAKLIPVTPEACVLVYPDRKLDLPDSIVPEALSDTDCANHGLWKRTHSDGKTVYYVNVPDVDNVLTAVLKLPYLLAELAYLTKEKNEGKLTKEFFDELFEKGISDKDFNEKARTFMKFYHDWKAKLAK